MILYESHTYTYVFFLCKFSMSVVYCNALHYKRLLHLLRRETVNDVFLQ